MTLLARKSSSTNIIYDGLRRHRDGLNEEQNNKVAQRRPYSTAEIIKHYRSRDLDLNSCLKLSERILAFLILRSVF